MPNKYHATLLCLLYGPVLHNAQYNMRLWMCDKQLNIVFFYGNEATILTVAKPKLILCAEDP